MTWLAPANATVLPLAGVNVPVRVNERLRVSRLPVSSVSVRPACRSRLPQETSPSPLRMAQSNAAAVSIRTASAAPGMPAGLQLFACCQAVVSGAPPPTHTLAATQSRTASFVPVRSWESSSFASPGPTPPSVPEESSIVQVRAVPSSPPVRSKRTFEIPAPPVKLNWWPSIVGLKAPEETTRYSALVGVVGSTSPKTTLFRETRLVFPGP